MQNPGTARPGTRGGPAAAGGGNFNKINCNFEYI